MIDYRIIEEKCNGCTVCFRNCPTGAVVGKKGEPHFIDHTLCTKCGVCFSSCGIGAVKKYDKIIEVLVT
jgi:Na+-translocating ferredoxin:NAD+ oxidoreductase RNF subunit RnfB